jgi:DNA-binding response OmpR family regulator
VLEPVTRSTQKPLLKLATTHRQSHTPAGTVAFPGTIKLLLVDSDEFYHKALQDYLSEGYKVELVRDSVEAISMILERTYDIILLNLNMPRVDGRELCLRVRKHHSTVPIVAFSAKLKRDADAAAVLRVGADIFISRPFAFNHVKASIDAVLRRSADTDGFADTLEYIETLEQEELSLRGIPMENPDTGLHTLRYFETKVREEIAKATLGRYKFSMAAYEIRPRNASSELEPLVWVAFRQNLRKADMVTQQSPGTYLLFLDKCPGPGIKRVNDRVYKAINRLSHEQGFMFRYTSATFPNDGQSYHDLVHLLLEKPDKTLLQLKRLS